MYHQPQRPRNASFLSSRSSLRQRPPQPQMSATKQNHFDPTCACCKLRSISIVGGLIVTVIGLSNLVELLDTSNSENCQIGLKFEYMLKNKIIDVSPEVVTAIKNKCGTILTGSFGSILAFTSAAVTAGLALVLAAMTESKFLALLSAVFMVLSVVIFVVEVATLYMLTPGRDPEIYSLVIEKELIMRTWGVARALHILALIIVAILFLYFAACAIKIFDGQKNKGKGDYKGEDGGWPGHPPQASPMEDPYAPPPPPPATEIQVTVTTEPQNNGAAPQPVREASVYMPQHIDDRRSNSSKNFKIVMQRSRRTRRTRRRKGYRDRDRSRRRGRRFTPRSRSRSRRTRRR